jgi:hypothetical protein
MEMRLVAGSFFSGSNKKFNKKLKQFLGNFNKYQCQSLLHKISLNNSRNFDNVVVF